MQDKPNILLVMADQMTALALSAYGGAVCKTPHLDRLAAEGVVFENAYCNYPLCAPSRYAMMTGCLPARIGAFDNGAELKASQPTFAHYLRAQGYYTCLSGKMHFVGPDPYHGFEERLTTEIYPADFSWTPTASYDDVHVDDERRYAAGTSTIETVFDAGPMARTMQIDYDEEVAHRAIQELYGLARHGDRPFAMTVSFTQPHDPYVTTQEFWELYSDDEIDPPKVPFVPLAERDPHSRSLYVHYGQDKRALDDADYRRARRGYYGMISYIDQLVGRLAATLRDTGFDRNTVVIFTADHGDMVGERGMWFKKTLFEPAVRVPLMVWAPQRFTPSRIAAPVSLVDLLPSLNQLAGGTDQDLAQEIDGKSLVPALAGGDAPAGIVFSEHLDGGTRAPRIMLRDGPWKLVYSRGYPAQLYDLANDPTELVDLAGEPGHADTLARLTQRIETAYDLDRLPALVTADQQRRRLIERANGTGRIDRWDFVAQPHIDRWFVRRGDAFPTVERRGYLAYGADES
jgi:choline-sulfatase